MIYMIKITRIEFKHHILFDIKHNLTMVEQAFLSVSTYCQTGMSDPLELVLLHFNEEKV